MPGRHFYLARELASTLPKGLIVNVFGWWATRSPWPRRKRAKAVRKQPETTQRKGPAPQQSLTYRCARPQAVTRTCDHQEGAHRTHEEATAISTEARTLSRGDASARSTYAAARAHGRQGQGTPPHRGRQTAARKQQQKQHAPHVTSRSSCRKVPQAAWVAPGTSESSSGAWALTHGSGPKVPPARHAAL